MHQIAHGPMLTHGVHKAGTRLGTLHRPFTHLAVDDPRVDSGVGIDELPNAPHPLGNLQSGIAVLHTVPPFGDDCNAQVTIPIHQPSEPGPEAWG
jgi:hypothetical protein